MAVKGRPAKVAVIGAGIGGLTTAALLAQTGYDVTVLESATYPGGCAATYYYQGFRFDTGATVAGGFQANGPHTLVGKQLDIDWPVRRSDPAWMVHLPDRSVRVAEDQTDLLAAFPGSETFWSQQAQIADLSWELSAKGLPWPPGSIADWSRLARLGLSHLPEGLRLLPYLPRTAYGWLQKLGLAGDKALVRFLDAQLLISAQTTSRHANAIYSATALDLPRQGVYHVQGGIGQLAATLAAKIESLGGAIRYRHRVTGISVENGQATGVHYQIGRHAKKTNTLPADVVVANLTPWSLNNLLGTKSPRKMRREVRRRQPGWGAFVLHLGVNGDALPDDLPDHHQIVTDMEGPLGEGRSIFLSLSPKWDETRAPEGQRAVTVTTHTAVQQWWDLHERDRAAYDDCKSRLADRILAEIDRVIPGFRRGIGLRMTGTPVTYNQYTRRHMGMVGGFPQTSPLRARGPRTGIANVRLVGDSIFPGQSTAGVTLGAMRVADEVQRIMGRQSTTKSRIRQMQMRTAGR